jgi:hypothetical protein
MPPINPVQISLFDEAIPTKEIVSALDELFANSNAFRRSADYFSMIQFVGRFTHYSAFNSFLLYVQNPKVTFVATPRKWKNKFGRSIKPEARPLIILAPMGPVLFVYDLADTEGKPIPESLLDPFATHGDLPRKVWNFTTQNARQDGIGIGLDEDFSMLQAGVVFRLPEPVYFRFSDTGERKVGPISFVIDINRDLPLNSRYASVVHELGHIYCGHLGAFNGAWWKDREGIDHPNKEIEAESVSYLVCKRRGLETKSEQYLALQGEKNIELPAISLDTILKTVSYIEGMGTRLPKPPKGIDR